ncbi:DNA-binding storekeeper protein-relatedtranscriptional regulator [Striga asiatica]|uniref:DNA-binding storekeeper protein-relatedtranscriptional regulator n=1 Tax=Striga asiatica TaxID=4170 RepID=A0A5A7R447_STRAF|nr:DNA-binding storekeeper protein-relatedtranscriptional regulator [Striga asiatica]
MASREPSSRKKTGCSPSQKHQNSLPNAPATRARRRRIPWRRRIHEDEVTLLKGMIAFRDAMGRDPSADLTAVHDSIEGKLKVVFSREQLRRKVNRLKTRYLNALKKAKNGEDPVFSNLHEDMLFELSKKIWFSSGRNIIETAKIWLKGFNKRTLAAADHLFEEGEMEDENQKAWKKLKIEETEVFLTHSKTISSASDSFTGGFFPHGTTLLLNLPLRQSLDWDYLKPFLSSSQTGMAIDVGLV